MSKKKEYGDFQTPLDFAKKCVSLVSTICSEIESVIEPTCGVGNFIIASNEMWNIPITGYEINESYFLKASSELEEIENVTIYRKNIFDFDFRSISNTTNLLILGNPPWVTNTRLSKLESNNIPEKGNFHNLTGLSALTGKSNFDISETIILSFLVNMNNSTKLAMLCKISTARKAIEYSWKNNIGIRNIKLFKIQAKEIFDASVGACLFYFEKSETPDKRAKVYSDIDISSYEYSFGFSNGKMVSNIDYYNKYSFLDGVSQFDWRSGVKHDLAKVMELTRVDDRFINGFDDVVDIEDLMIFPLLKSSDLANGRFEPRKYVIITQHRIGEDTSKIEKLAPKTWNYLQKYKLLFKNRKSRIYKNQPDFSIFGVGSYTFSNWKVAISGLYKNKRFVALGTYNNKPFVLDDTCYFFSCESKSEAKYFVNLLNSIVAQEFIKSITFSDSKRPITSDLLSRINIQELANAMDVYDEGEKYLLKHNSNQLFLNI